MLFADMSIGGSQTLPIIVFPPFFRKQCLLMHLVSLQVDMFCVRTLDFLSFLTAINAFLALW